MEVLLLLEINGMKFPLDRSYYTKDGAHIWLKSEKNFIKLGMDAFAVEMIGFFNFFTINKRRVKSGEAIGSFESAKFVSRFYTPISGEIIEVNNKVLNNPRKINDDPYNSWIVTIKPDNNEDGSKYIIEGKDKVSKWISEEIERLKSDK